MKNSLEKLITKSFKRLLDKGLHRGFITFEELTAGASKRTAASCFLEILQLKTWGYIDTAQSVPFADISIHATVSINTTLYDDDT